MKKLSFRKAILVICALGLSTGVFAQLAMTRTTFTAPYTPISTATGATASTASGDDGVETGIPIGFTFNYLGTNYTTIGANTNGAAGFVAMTNTRFNTDLYNTTAPTAILAPWWDDLTSPAGTMMYQTQGTPGSQTFTMQWSSMSYFTGSTAVIDFQVILYEGTNVIEYHYGAQPTGTFSGSESACIGMKSQTGGNGQYLDAVTGSCFTGNATISSNTMWPSRNFRFTPGAPAVLAGGVYTVGNAGTYFNLSEAVADVNHRGISGPVTLSLIDANYDVTTANGHNFFPIMVGPVAGTSAISPLTIMPASGTATITSAGFTQTGGFGVSQSSTNIIGTGNEPVIAVVGGQYIGMSNLDLVAGAATLDRGLVVLNSSATLGSQNCAFQNISVTLFRTNTSSIGIEQRVPTVPASAAGANSNNAYLNLSISNTYSGIVLTGNATNPDMNCQVGTTSPTTFNSIGAATANDIGGGTSASYGIRATSQSGVSIFNNEVRNIGVSGSVVCDGIFLETAQGTSSVYMNKVHDQRNSSTTATTGLSGIRANVATTGTHTIRVYNNFIYNQSTGYTGAATATRQVKGIYVQSAGSGTATSTINVDFNNVNIDLGTNLNASGTCFEIGTASGPVMNVRNNVFSNTTGAQTAPAGHYNWVSTSATATGNTGSVSDYNDLYIANATQGFTGRGATTDYPTLATWQAAMVQDANSLTADPAFTSATNLHVNSPSLNAAANMTGITWVTVDIDNEARSGSPDIGADEFVLAPLDAGVTTLVTPAAGNCHTATEQVTVRIRNFGANALDMMVNPVTVTVNITGAVTQTLNITLNDNTLNGGIPLASGATLDVPVGTFNMTTAGTYTFNSFTAVTGDPNTANDAMPPANISFLAGTATATPGSVCQGSATTLTLAGQTNSTLQWEMSTDGGFTWAPIAGATTTPYVDTPADTTMYRALVCGVITSTADTVIYIPTTPPVTVNDTVCGLDTAMLTASGTGTLNWYTTASGGSAINTGTSYSPFVSATTTYYVESTTGGGSGNVGAPSNTIGGGLMSTAPQWLIFDVLQSCVLQSVVVYPGAAGNVILEWRNSANGVIQSTTFAVTAGQINTPVVVPLNWNLVPGTAYRLALGAGSVSLYRNDAGAAYPYTLPGIVSITGNSFNVSYYYWAYNWTVSAGCSSTRIPVTAVVLPTAPVSITANSTALCAGDTATLTANSTNMSYSYSWTPSASLSSPTGATVSAFPAAATSYIVTADSSGCVAMDTIAIAVNPLPVAVVSQSDTLICIGESDTLIAVDPFAGPFINTTSVPVPDNNPAGASSVINIPYAAAINPSMSMRVCMNVTHTWDGDMSFTLISPTGTQLDLCSGNGGSGDNFTNTCFTMSAATNITTGTAPFTGSYIPEGAGGFNVYNDETTQGNWTLFMADGAGGDVGTLNAWSIRFTTNNQVSWTSNPVGFTSANDTIIVNPAVTTDYIMTVTDTITGCSMSYTQTVMVNPPLSLSVSSDTLICAGDSAILMAMASGGDGNIAYSWSNGPVTMNDTVSPASTTMYYVTVTDGCTTPSAMDSVNVIIPSPISITGISNDTMLCANDTLVLSVVTAGGDGNTSYAWSNGPVTANDTINSGAPGMTTLYAVMVMDGCATMAADTVSVTTYAAPAVLITTADTTICSGDTVIANAMASGGDGNFSYSWSNGPVTSTDTTVTTVMTDYVVTVTDGCSLTAADTFTVDVFAPVTITVSNDTSICYPTSAYLASMGGSGDGSYTYLWSDGMTTANDTVTPFGTLTMYVTVTDGCGSTANDSVLVTVGTSPIANFTSSTTGATVTFTDASSGATSYQWDFGDTQTSTTQNPNHTYASNGVYTVTLVVTNSCGTDTFTTTVSISVGIDDPATFESIRIYPNPSSGQFNVSFGMAIGGDVTLELFDVQGKLLQQQQLSAVSAGAIQQLNVQGYETGMYMLRITTGASSRTYKLNVQE